MNQDELKMVVALYEAVLQTKELQTAFAQMVIGEFEKMHAVARLRREMQQTVESPEKAALTAQLDRLEFEYGSDICFDALKPLLEQQAAEIELIRSVLEKLKAAPE